MERAAYGEIVAFLAVAESRSFRSAAQRRGVSPSALSHAVRQLEERLGVRLFNRTTRSVTLTDAGAVFLERVRPAVEGLAAALGEASERRDRPSGRLRINSAKSMAHLVLAPAVAAFLARHPEVELEISTEDRMVDIVAEGFDAGVRVADAVPRDMVAVPIAPDFRFVVAGAPAYLEGRTPPQAPHDLLGHACLRFRFPSGGIFRWDLGKEGETVVVDIGGPLVTNDRTLLIAAALDGAGLVFLPEPVLRPHIAAGRLRPLLEPWCPLVPGPVLYYPGHRHVPAALRAFIDALRGRPWPPAAVTSAHRPAPA